MRLKLILPSLIALGLATALPAQAENATPLKIGVLMPTKTLMGKQDVQGAELAATLINEKGGVNGEKIRLIVYDDANSAVDAVSAAQRLIDEDGVKMILGEISSTAALAVLRVAQAENVIYMPVVPKHPDLTKSGYPNIFQMNSAFEDETKAFNAMLKDKLHTRTIAYIGENSDAGRLYLSSFRNLYKMKYIGFYDFTQSDFNNLVTDAKASGADTLITGGAFVEQYANVLRAAQSLNYQPKHVAVLPGFLNRSFVDLAGKAANGVMSVDIYLPDFKNPENRKFVAAFEKKYAREPEKQEELAYEAVLILADAVAKAGTASDVDKIAAHIRSDTVSTPRGQVHFNKRGQAVSENGNFVVVVRNGRIVRD